MFTVSVLSEGIAVVVLSTRPFTSAITALATISKVSVPVVPRVETATLKAAGLPVAATLLTVIGTLPAVAAKSVTLTVPAFIGSLKVTV